MNEQEIYIEHLPWETLVSMRDEAYTLRTDLHEISGLTPEYSKISGIAVALSEEIERRLFNLKNLPIKKTKKQ